MIKPHAFVVYHYLPPDDVVSAVLFGDLCEGLVDSGWTVTAFPCKWGCRDEFRAFPSLQVWNGVKIKRIWRPRLRQASTMGRLLNAVWMIMRWSFLALRKGSTPDILIIGTDPVLSILTALSWRLIRPKTKIVHWCHDLFPEAAVCDGILPAHSIVARFLNWILKPAYRSCSMIVDLGPCMRNLLLKYPSNARRETITPWALDEAAASLHLVQSERRRIYGDAPLALMYSGSYGRAHSCNAVLDLLEMLQPNGAQMAFSIRGNRSEELRRTVAQRDLKVSFLDFATPGELSARLGSADIHVVTLNAEWTGTVVPSKFFGALSAGRPILFYGDSTSSLAHWIRLYHVGWVLDDSNAIEVCNAIRHYADSATEQATMQNRCFHVYEVNFSRRVQMKKWNDSLRSLLCCS